MVYHAAAVTVAYLTIYVCKRWVMWRFVGTSGQLMLLWLKSGNFWTPLCVGGGDAADGAQQRRRRGRRTIKTAMEKHGVMEHCGVASRTRPQRVRSTDNLARKPPILAV